MTRKHNKRRNKDFLDYDSIVTDDEVNDILECYVNEKNEEEAIIEGVIKETLQDSGIVRADVPEAPTYEPITPIECLAKLKELVLKHLEVEPPITELTFSLGAWLKINAYIHLVNTLEITGFGKIENGIITDVAILPQVIAGATAETITEREVGTFYQSLPENERHLWTLDWHSHVNMGTSPSITDDNNYDVMHQLRGNESFPVMIINKRQDVWCANYIAHKLYLDIKINKPLTQKMKIKELITYNKWINTIYDDCIDDVIANCIEKKEKKIIKTASCMLYPNPYPNPNRGRGFNSAQNLYQNSSQKTNFYGY